jgi:pyrroline-5-carboxylate reductase
MSTAIIGAGVMGETLLSGLVRAGRRVDHLLVGEKRSERATELEESVRRGRRLQQARPPPRPTPWRWS